MAGLSPQHELTHTRVEDVMHRGLVTCPPSTPLRTVARILAAHRIHAVVVAEDRAHEATGVWGVVTDLDVVGSLAEGRGEETATTVAVAPAVAVAPDETLARASLLMAMRGVTHILVVDPDSHRPVGMLSTLDVAEALAR